MTDDPRAGRRRRGTGRGSFVLAVAGILLVALNLRIPTTALGPLLPTIRADTGHGETFLSLLTSVPLALTLVVAPFAPALAARFGRHAVLGGALVGIVLGTGVRSIPGDGALLAGTALLGAAIALGTVLLPAAIAAEDPFRRAPLTGVLTMALSLGPALALGLTVPLMRASGAGWRGTLLLWSLCAVLALAVWVANARSARSGGGRRASSGTGKVAAPGDGDADVARRPVADPRVWVLALYLGVTSLTFYTTSAWLPTAFRLDGLSAGPAGGYASLVNLVALPFGLLAPAVMRRGWSPVLAPLAPLVSAAGVGLLLIAGAGAALPVALLLGAGQGLCLGVAYDRIVQYPSSAGHAASVSALTSTVGIAVAALGPLMFGYGLEATGSAGVPLGGLAAVLLAQATLGLATGRLRPGGDDLTPARGAP